MKDEFLKAVKSKVKYWWISLLVGILAFIVGCWAIAAPVTTISVLTIFFIASLMVSGLSDILFAVSNRKQLDGWGWTLAIGIISLIFSFILLSRPIESIFVLIALAGFWVMFVSIMQISGSIEMQRAGIKGWGWLLAFGILGVILAFILISNPAFASSFIVAIFSISMICYGVIRIYLSFKMRKINKEIGDVE